MAKKQEKDTATFSYGGVELKLTKSTTEAAVRYTEAHDRSAARSSLAPPVNIQDFEVISAKSNIDKKLDKMRGEPDVDVGTHVWNVDGEDDTPFIPTGNLYIEFVAGTEERTQLDILEKLGLSVKEIVGPGAFRVSVSNLSPNPIKCAIQLQENELVAVAEPEFATAPAQRDFSAPSGRFVATQWHHENSGQAIPAIDAPNSVYAASHFRRGADAKVRDAWNYLGSLGDSNLKIAVIDTGFATDHPQLRGDGYKIRSPYNAAARNTDVSPYVRYSNGSFGVVSHGTSCAAVAAGAWDVQGVLGAAPNARLMLIKLEVLSDDAIKNAFEHALLNGADVISCSLGYPKPVPLSTYVTNYLRKVAREGRNGRGIPMFFAAGNANPASNYMPRQVSDFAAHPDGFCVTASNSLDQRSSYSFYGSNAFLCAPTNGDSGVGITTATCDLGSDGRSVVLGYTSGFGGTSSSAPLAAGICALLLTANPNLMVADIRNILRQSCDKIGPGGTYNTAGHSDFYGYGRINALRAVQMASNLRSGGSTSSVPVNVPTNIPTNVPTVSVATGQVTSTFLNVRSGPSTAYGKVGRLSQRDIVNLLEKVSGFWRIASGQYVSADYIKVLPSQNGSRTQTTSTPQGRVTSSYLNVRSGPSTAYGQIDRLNRGELVQVLGNSSGGWLKIGSNRWVYGQYVEMV